MSEAGIVVTPGQPGPSLTDKLVSAMGDFDMEDSGGEQAEPERKPRRSADAREKPAKNPRDEAPEDDEEDVSAAPLDDGAEESEEGDEGGEHEPEDTRGSKEDPYSVKELPTDKYIEIKVDGEKKAVTLRELADGYTRTEAFTKRMNQSQLLVNQAKEYVEKAKAFPQKFQENFREFTSDPVQIYEFFMATPEREAVFVRAATALAEHSRKAREDPEYRVGYQRKRDEDRLRGEREAFETQKRAEMQQKENEQRRQNALAIFTPGWNEGLKKAGFPELDPKTRQKLQEEVLFRCSQRHQQGGQVTSEDVADFTLRSARAMGLEGKRAARPAAAPTPRRTAQAATQKKDWSNVPSSERRGDPKWYLQGVKTRDLLGR